MANIGLYREVEISGVRMPLYTAIVLGELCRESANGNLGFTFGEFQTRLYPFYGMRYNDVDHAWRKLRNTGFAHESHRFGEKQKVLMLGRGGGVDVSYPKDEE